MASQGAGIQISSGYQTVGDDGKPRLQTFQGRAVSRNWKTGLTRTDVKAGFGRWTLVRKEPRDSAVDFW